MPLTHLVTGMGVRPYSDPRACCRSQRPQVVCFTVSRIGTSQKIRVPYVGVLIIRILLFRVLYEGPLNFRKPPIRPFEVFLLIMAHLSYGTTAARQRKRKPLWGSLKTWEFQETGQPGSPRRSSDLVRRDLRTRRTKMEFEKDPPQSSFEASILNYDAGATSCLDTS